jgi:flagellar basal body-associated protein FliL
MATMREFEVTTDEFRIFIYAMSPSSKGNIIIIIIIIIIILLLLRVKSCNIFRVGGNKTFLSAVRCQPVTART